MKQLTQQLKSGKMKILDVPFPALNKGEVLVRNYFSVISTGTEGKTVSDARKGYIAKAKSRKKEVNQVIKMIEDNGLLNTYKFVMNKLEAPSPLGYSCSGKVISVSDDVKKIKDIELTHINLNDNTVEGIRLKNKNAFSVQYHPESSPGPHDSRYLFDDFVKMMN